jgi:hypothetical protein
LPGLMFCGLQEAAHTPDQQKNPPPQIACFKWLSANLRIVRWIVFQNLRTPTRTSPGMVAGHIGDCGMAPFMVKLGGSRV